MNGWRLPGTLLLFQQVVALCGLASGASALAQPANEPTAAVRAAKTLPAELFFKTEGIDEAVLSPSGRHLAVTSAKAGSKFGLYVYDLAAGGTARRVAQYNDVHVVGVRWVNDNRLLFSATEFRSTFNRAYGLPGLYAVNADGTHSLQLVERVPGTPPADDRAGRAALHFLHALLHVPAPRPDAPNDEILVGELEGDWGGITNVKPVWLNVVNRRTRPADFKSPPHTVAWLFDSRGNPRAAQTREDERVAMYWRALGEQDWMQIGAGKLLNLPFELQAVDDAGTLYVTQPAGEQATRVLRRYDFERHAPAKTALIETPGFDFDGNVILSEGRLAGAHVEVDAATTVWFDARMKQFQAEVDTKLPDRVNRISCAGCAGPGAVVLVESRTGSDPGQWLIYRPRPEPGQSAWQLVGSRREGIDERSMAAVALHRIQARDGRDLPVWLTQPQGMQAGAPVPSVVLVHGGPWVRGGRWQWDGMAQFLASRGYLVISPEFRGSTGYGESHFRAGWKQWGQSMQDDVADALIWARKQGLTDERTCIAGASYGGYSTLMGLARHPQLYRCGVAWAAVSDLRLTLKGEWFVADDAGLPLRKHLLPELVGDAEKDSGMIDRNSPVLLASAIKAPLLLAHGEEDLRVPLAHAQRMRAQLKEAGREPEWVTYRGEGHGFAVEANQVDFARRMETFLARHLAASRMPAER
jgi:dipeptidyl aminopeptidase/acylaminoacyl peptidase